MHGVIVQAFAERIKAGLMELEQVPQVFRGDVAKLLEGEDDQ